MTEQKGVAVVKDGETALAPAQSDDPFALIAHLVQRGEVDVNTLKELCELQREMKADRAKEAFVAAMAAFQAECPVIDKRKPVYGKDKETGRQHSRPTYHYAPMEDLVRQAGPLIARCGFSYDFDTEVSDRVFTARCNVTHRDGHTQTRSFSIPVGDEKFMSEAQKFGARATYAKRNAFCNAFGITTGDEDTDAAPEVPREPPRRIEQPTGEVMSEAAVEAAINAIMEAAEENLGEVSQRGLDAAKALKDRDAYKRILIALEWRTLELLGDAPPRPEVEEKIRAGIRPPKQEGKA